MKEFFYIIPIVTAWRKSVDSKYLVPYNKSIQRIFDTLFIKLFCRCSFITLYSVWCIPLYSIHLNTTRQCQYITTRQCQQIRILAAFVEICRIYEVSKNFVEKFCRNQSKNVVETSRNLSKFVEICRNLSKFVEKCCRNVENVFFDFSYPLAIRVKKLPAGSTHTHACVRGIFFWIFFEFFFEFFLELFNK